jgi:hypothetical protein
MTEKQWIQQQVASWPRWLESQDSDDFKRLVKDASLEWIVEPLRAQDEERRKNCQQNFTVLTTEYPSQDAFLAAYWRLKGEFPSKLARFAAGISRDDELDRLSDTVEYQLVKWHFSRLHRLLAEYHQVRWGSDIGITAEATSRWLKSKFVDWPSYLRTEDAAELLSCFEGEMLVGVTEMLSKMEHDQRGQTWKQLNEIVSGCRDQQMFVTTIAALSADLERTIAAIGRSGGDDERSQLTRTCLVEITRLHVSHMHRLLIEWQSVRWG